MWISMKWGLNSADDRRIWDEVPAHVLSLVVVVSQVKCQALVNFLTITQQNIEV